MAELAIASFDHPPPAMPISWRWTLQRHAGRTRRDEFVRRQRIWRRYGRKRLVLGAMTSFAALSKRATCFDQLHRFTGWRAVLISVPLLSDDRAALVLVVADLAWRQSVKQVRLLSAFLQAKPRRL